MSLPISRLPMVAASLTVLGVTALGPVPAQAAPACEGPVAGALHTLHDATGDPAGLVHEAEETYCTVAH